MYPKVECIHMAGVSDIGVDWVDFWLRVQCVVCYTRGL